jgi:alpha-galactosidase
VVTPPQVSGRTIEIEANHRGYHCDRETEEGLKQDIEVAQAIGVELYTIDAGWYGRPPNQWWNAVGDWEAGPWLLNGLEPVVGHARASGMRFGLWVEIEAAGANSRLKEDHPDWLMTNDRKPVANGRALDLSKPEVAAWCEAELNRLIDRYKLDMYRIDHNHCMEPMGNREVGGFTEDSGWRYYEAFDAMFKRLLKAHPGVVFQNCAGGGGRLDWGTLHRFHNSEQSDCMRQPRSLKVFNGLTMSIPPALLMRTFGTETGEISLDGDIDAQLRGALICRPNFRGIAPTVGDLSPWLAERIAYHVGLFQGVLRPLLLDCKVFHHTPFLRHQDADPWLVLEFASPDRARAIAVLFRHALCGDGCWRFFPRGLDASRSYTVCSDNHRWKCEFTGSELMQSGIPVTLGRPMSSELLIFEAKQ